MTNVPDQIRAAWKDLYILFDTHYAMDGSQEAWEKYWAEGMELIKKHGDGIPLFELIEATAHQIESFVKQRNSAAKTGEKTLMWGKDEDYPYPVLNAEFQPKNQRRE